MKIEFSKKAEKQFSKLDTRIQEKIIKIIDRPLKGDKVDIKKIRGFEDLYRIRTGEYRIALEKINSDLFVVPFIGKRESFYE